MDGTEGPVRGNVVNDTGNPIMITVGPETFGRIINVESEHYDIARDMQKILQVYKSLQDIIDILGMDELFEEDKVNVNQNSEHRNWEIHLWKIENNLLCQNHLLRD